MDLLEPMEQAGELDSYLFLLLFYSNWLICSREYLLIICITPKTTHTHPSFSQNNPPPISPSLHLLPYGRPSQHLSEFSRLDWGSTS